MAGLHPSEQSIRPKHAWLFSRLSPRHPLSIEPNTAVHFATMSGLRVAGGVAKKNAKKAAKGFSH